METKTLKSRMMQLSARKRTNGAVISTGINFDSVLLESELRRMLPDLFAELDAERNIVREEKSGFFNRLFNRKSERSYHTIKALKERGENFVFEVGGRYIVKVQDMAPGERVAQETLTQELLAERIGGPVPRVTHISETHHAFAMEKKEGVTLAAYLRENPNPEDRIIRTLGDDIEDFARKAADAISPEEYQALGLDKNSILKIEPDRLDNLGVNEDGDPLAHLMQALDKSGLEQIEGGAEIGDALASAYQDGKRRVFFRDDSRNEDNFIIDPETGHLTGMIDFGRIGITQKHRLNIAYNWTFAHRHGEMRRKLPDEVLFELAEQVAQKYRKTREVPDAERWIEQAQRLLDMPDEPDSVLPGDACFQPENAVPTLRQTEGQAASPRASNSQTAIPRLREAQGAARQRKLNQKSES